jgi:hypothetical protein
MIKLKKNVHSQQETIGFIIIILMVMIVGVIFLGLSLRKGNYEVVAVDAEIANFLSASAAYKTDCALDYEPNYRTLGEVAVDCYNNNRACLNEKNSCEVLNSSYKDILKNFRPGGKPTSYYKLSFYYQVNISESLGDARRFGDIIEKGNSSLCVSRRAGKNDISLGGQGNIVELLEVCLAE